MPRLEVPVFAYVAERIALDLNGGDWGVREVPLDGDHDLDDQHEEEADQLVDLGDRTTHSHRRHRPVQRQSSNISTNLYLLLKGEHLFCFACKETIRKAGSCFADLCALFYNQERCIVLWQFIMTKNLS